MLVGLGEILCIFIVIIPFVICLIESCSYECNVKVKSY